PLLAEPPDGPPELLLFVAEREVHGFSLPTTHIAKNCDPPPYAWPNPMRAPSTWCSPAWPRTCMAASANRSIPLAPIGLDDSTPPDASTGVSPWSAVAPSSTSFQPSPSSASP